MPRITVWQCRKTKALFLTTKEFKLHLCRRAAERAFARKRKARMDAALARVGELRRQTSFAEIEEWVNNNGDALYLLQLEKGRMWRGGKKPSRVVPKDFKLWDFKLTNMRWSESQRCTHCAPIGKPTNFRSEDDKPKGYPGWYGRVEFRMKGYEGFSSSIFEGTGINTGSGGGGERLSYDCTIFAEDFFHMLMMMKLEGRFEGEQSRSYYNY